MAEKVVTVSARISRSYADLIEEHRKVMGGSKTDVLQRALDLLAHFDVARGRNQVTVGISEYNLRRAHRLHFKYGYRSSFPVLLEEALERGVRDLYAEYSRDMETDRSHDASRKRVDAMDLELEVTKTG